ncbi:MAG: response regulator transcription factor [Dinoroseobacter sp.]|nr:response regulator transcription factor [Dinoroseobacter sp.]
MPRKPGLRGERPALLHPLALEKPAESDSSANQQRILIIEDDVATSKLLGGYLELDGFSIECAYEAATAKALISKLSFDAIVLDLGLPDVDDLSFAQHVRSVSDAPIIIVSKQKEEEVKISSLELGIDDYLSKPFSPRELSARIKNIARRRFRNEHSNGETAELHIGNWTFDKSRRSVASSTGHNLSLTRGEFELVFALIEAEGRVLSRAQLLDAIDSDALEKTDRTVDVLVSRVRSKLRETNELDDLILTVIGIGYRANL